MFDDSISNSCLFRTSDCKNPAGNNNSRRPTLKSLDCCIRQYHLSLSLRLTITIRNGKNIQVESYKRNAPVADEDEVIAATKSAERPNRRTTTLFIAVSPFSTALQM